MYSWTTEDGMKVSIPGDGTNLTPERKRKIEEVMRECLGDITVQPDPDEEVARRRRTMRIVQDD